MFDIAPFICWETVVYCLPKWLMVEHSSNVIGSLSDHIRKFSELTMSSFHRNICWIYQHPHTHARAHANFHPKRSRIVFFFACGSCFLLSTFFFNSFVISSCDPLMVSTHFSTVFGITLWKRCTLHPKHRLHQSQHIFIKHFTITEKQDVNGMHTVQQYRHNNCAVCVR